MVLKVIIYRRSSYYKCHLPSKVIFHKSLSPYNSCLPSKGCLSTNVVFHQRLSFYKCCLPSMVLFHQRLSTTRLTRFGKRCNSKQNKFFDPRSPCMRNRCDRENRNWEIEAVQYWICLLNNYWWWTSTQRESVNLKKAKSYLGKG